MYTTFITKENHEEIDFVNKVVSIIYRGKLFDRIQRDNITREFTTYTQRFLYTYEQFKIQVNNGNFDKQAIRKENVDLILKSIRNTLFSNSSQVFDVARIKSLLDGNYFTEDEKIKISELLNFITNEDIEYFTAYNGCQVTREYMEFISSLRSVENQLEPREIDRIILQLDLCNQILDMLSTKEQQ